MIEVKWVPICGGYVSVGHRPSSKTIRQISESGCTHIVTLMTDEEGAQDVRKLVENIGIEWLHMPIRNASANINKIPVFIKWFVEIIIPNLESGARIYIHCSAGIHRTGMFSNALLRYIGYSEKEAASVLLMLRDKLTSERIGEHRVNLGNLIKKGANK